MMSKRILKCLISLVLTFYLYGCVPKKTIDEIAIMHNVGFDSVDDQFKGSVIYPNYADDDKAILISAKAKNPSSLIEKIGNKSQYEIELGQIRTIVFGNKISKKGIAEILETICKDPLIGNIRVVVSDKSAHDLLKPTLEHPPLYLMNLVDKSIQDEGIPDVSLHTLYDQYYGEGVDIYLPNLTLDAQGKVQINGLGIFKDDKLKLTLSEKETFIFNAINEKNKRGIYEFILKKDGKKSNIGVELLFGKENIKFKQGSNNDKAILNLTLNFELMGVPKGMDIETASGRSFIESQLENAISVEITSLLKKLQNHKVDPLGLGVSLRSQNRKWNETFFYKNTYPTMRFEVNTKVNILYAGVGTS
jgi:spore germination protein